MSQEKKDKRGVIIFKVSRFWHFRFQMDGQLYRESTRCTDPRAAQNVANNRWNELRAAAAGVALPPRLGLFDDEADIWLDSKDGTGHWSNRTAAIERANLVHLKSFFGAMRLTAISHDDVTEYRKKRLKGGAAPKTVHLEMGTLRAIMRRNKLISQWADIRESLPKLGINKIGQVLTQAEEVILLRECRASRSRSLAVAVILALETCMRYSELRLLRWRQIDTVRRIVTVGQSKTQAGTGREIPLTPRAVAQLAEWAQSFPKKKLSDYLFPSERYGGRGNDDSFGFVGGCVYKCNPSEPIHSWKEAWEAAKKRAGVEIRFHDLRHTGCTRMLEAGNSHAVVGELMGWSTSTTIYMIKNVYGNVGPKAKRQAIDLFAEHTEQERALYLAEVRELAEAQADPAQSSQESGHTRESRKAERIQ